MFTENAKTLKAAVKELSNLGVSGLDFIEGDVDKLCKYGEDDAYMKMLQEIIDMLGAHGALLQYEIYEVMTPERFDYYHRCLHSWYCQSPPHRLK